MDDTENDLEYYGEETVGLCQSEIRTNNDIGESNCHIGMPAHNDVREVLCEDAIEWMRHRQNIGELFPGSVFTSMPDISELAATQFAGLTVAGRVQAYEKWFVNAATLVLQLLPVGECAVFLQSDVRVCDENGALFKWLDKGALCSVAAAAVCGSDESLPQSGLITLLWHKIVFSGNLQCRSAGRPTYSHLMCFGRQVTYDSGDFATPDVFDRGHMLWSKGIGLECCVAGMSFLRRVVHTRTVVDPFCGYGTVLAVANSLGLAALGVELSSRRCSRARGLCVREKLARISPGRLSVLGLPREDQVQLGLYVHTTQSLFKRRMSSDNVEGAIDADGETTAALFMDCAAMRKLSDGITRYNRTELLSLRWQEKSH